MCVVDWVGFVDEVDGGGEWGVVMKVALGKEMDMGADGVCDAVRYSGDTGAFSFNCGGVQVMLEVAFYLMYTLFPILLTCEGLCYSYNLSIWQALYMDNVYSHPAVVLRAR